MINEVWKDIPGYEGKYQVSTFGRVRSLTRKVHNYIKQGRILKSNNNGHYYEYVSLQGKKHYIHRLVASAFLDNPLNLREVNHKDFNKTNNFVENLEWVSSKENKLHFKKSKYYKESQAKKIKNVMSKTTKRILENKDNILKLWKEANTIEEIAKKLNLGRDFVSQVIELYKEFLIYV